MKIAVTERFSIW